MLVIFLVPMAAFSDGTLDFNLQNFNLLSTSAQITSVEGFGGSVNSGVTLPVSSGFLDLTISGGPLGWLSGGSLEITGSGTIGSLGLSGAQLLAATFTGVAPSGLLGFTLTGFSATINQTLAGYYGLSNTASQGDFYLSLSSATLAVDPPTAAAESGGIAVTLLVLMGAALCFAAGVRLKMIKFAF
ncbi:MAG: hypothetical protein ACRD2P_14985 [Terriglobia bacterium]